MVRFCELGARSCHMRQRARDQKTWVKFVFGLCQEYPGKVFINCMWTWPCKFVQVQLFLLGSRKSKSVPWFAGKWPVFYELMPAEWERGQSPRALGVAHEASWPGHASGLPIRSAFLRGSCSFKFSFLELTMQNDPCLWNTSSNTTWQNALG